jgi:protein-S-isoprenylcysteine O-methyltransferase Ste14
MKTLLVLALRLLVLAVLLLSPLLLAAGRLDVWGAWGWALVMWLSATTIYGLMLCRSPALVEERLRPPSDRDRATRRLVVAPVLLHLVLAGLDARLGWSRVPLAVQVSALAATAAGFALVGWVLLTNPFASSAVRIQSERGHAVITHGPYALVRHPMYLATLLVCLSMGPALGSWWAALALLPVIAVFIRRTALEDRMLCDELDGYGSYAQRIRWRVVPLVF